MKKIAAIFLITLGNCLNLQAQKVEEINPSGFTHKYVVSDLKYVEDLQDTIRLHYISTLRISGPQHKLQNLIAWMDLLEIKARLMGADAYYVQSYIDTDTQAELLVKFFFGGSSFLKVNAGKRLTNTVFLFNQMRTDTATAHVYVNGNFKKLDPRTYYKMQFILNEKKTIGLTNNGVGQERSLQFKKVKSARFFILAANKSALTLVYARPDLAISEVSWNLNQMDGRIPELNYDTGRLLIAAYEKL